jgi:hypothetical protein
MRARNGNVMGRKKENTEEAKTPSQFNTGFLNRRNIV